MPNIAILGATGEVGRTFISVLEERKFPVDKIYFLASERSAGEDVLFRNRSYEVLAANEFDFSGVDIALFSAGSEASLMYAPRATEAGCVVIDNSSQFRYDPDVPLIIPEVNSHKIADYRERMIIANPNCSTIQMLVAVKPIYDAVGVSRINIATYQAVSGSGRRAITELADQAIELLNGRPIEKNVYPLQIAFNLIPQVDIFLDNGYTKEEMKLLWETQKILDDPEILVNATAVRVPVFYGHSEAIHLETRQKITADEARQLLSQASGVVLHDEHKPGGYPSPAMQSIGDDAVYVGRVREDITNSLGLNMWVVADFSKRLDRTIEMFTCMRR